MKVFLTWPAELCAAFIKTFHYFGYIWLGYICLLYLFHDVYPNDYNGFCIFVPQRYFVDILLSHSIIIITTIIIFSLSYFYSVSLNLETCSINVILGSTMVCLVQHGMDDRNGLTEIALQQYSNWGNAVVKKLAFKIHFFLFSFEH